MHNKRELLNSCDCFPLHSSSHSLFLAFCLPQGIKGFTSELFPFIEQWSDYYGDEGEETAHLHDTYKYYFPENFDDEDYRYEPCILLNNAKRQCHLFDKGCVFQISLLTLKQFGLVFQQFACTAFCAKQKLLQYLVYVGLEQEVFPLLYLHLCKTYMYFPES